MKIGHFGPTFIFPGKTVNFFGVKHVAPSSTLKMRKSHKKSARVYAYTHAYTQLRDGGGRSAPPGSYRVKEMHIVRKVLQLRISLCSLSQFRRKHCVRNPLCNRKMSLNWTGCSSVAFSFVCHFKRANRIWQFF